MPICVQTHTSPPLNHSPVEIGNRPLGGVLLGRDVAKTLAVTACDRVAIAMNYITADQPTALAALFGAMLKLGSRLSPTRYVRACSLRKDASRYTKQSFPTPERWFEKRRWTESRCHSR